mmetsp:Transcript_17129/g.47099  ORF Transcript_17129/g.47099 Transcript_17129/m.47099 type:complete len:179 (-) Transcript_17129:2074-2610(-)
MDLETSTTQSHCKTRQNTGASPIESYRFMYCFEHGRVVGKTKSPTTNRPIWAGNSSIRSPKLVGTMAWVATQNEGIQFFAEGGVVQVLETSKLFRDSRRDTVFIPHYYNHNYLVHSTVQCRFDRDQRQSTRFSTFENERCEGQSRFDVRCRTTLLFGGKRRNQSPEPPTVSIKSRILC